MIELLAPAKDKNCAIAAINYGADAIYIGTSEFGARKKAPNSLTDIKEVVEYAHKFNVKVYVTINTILTDDELLRAKELVEKLTEIGVDAIIIQDMGLIGSFSPLTSHPSLHASTQCDNRTVEKVKFLEEAGFSRVILARELSIEQIAEIKSQTNIELETFIHGSLCVSYSGQCYLSNLIGGRSANRGECAQPCRKKYSLVDEDGNFIEKDKHLLNLKDFNASKHLKALAEAGVTSFKIEGRLKDENYVKNVVGYYRKLIDELGLGKTSSGHIIFDFEPNLAKSFNRGFTDYFLKGAGTNVNDCHSFLTPKSMGEKIGKITKIGQDFFELSQYYSSPFTLHSQDGLCFYVDESLSGCLINKTTMVKSFDYQDEKQRIYPNKMDGLKVGMQLYRNVDSEFEKKLKNSKTCRKITAEIEFGLGKIKIVDEDKNSTELAYKFDEIAQNEEKMIENIKVQFKKSGESDFLVENVEIKTEKIPFLPISKLNEIRRELLEKLMTVRMNRNLESQKLKSSETVKPKSSQTSNLPKEIDYRGNVLNKYAKEFYENRGCKVTEMALEYSTLSESAKAGKCAMTTKHCLKYAFNMCQSGKSLFLVDEKNKQYPLKFNCKNCEMEIYFGKD